MHYVLIIVVFLPLLTLAQSSQVPTIEYNNSHYDINLLNEPTTGTVLHQLVKGTTGSSPLQGVVTAAGDAGAIGVCSSNCGTTGSATIDITGATSCDFDGATTSRNYVVISPTVAGKCHDAGSTRPMSNRIIGRVTSTNATAGTYGVIMYGSGVDGGIEIPATPAGNFARDDGTWQPISSGGLPSGMIAMILSGTCPAGFTETTALNGKMLRGTLAANGDVGTTGGSATITPSGTVSQPTFAGNAITQVINHTHPVNITDPGHTHLTQRYPTATGGSSGFTIDTSMSGTLADNTLPVKTATTGITATSSNPAGGVSSITPTGTVSQPTFTGTPIDPSPSYVKVIFCQKT